jgi:surface antigen
VHQLVALVRRYGLLSLASLAVMLATAPCVHAQRVPSQMPGTELAWPGLTPDDVERMYAAAARLYEGRSIGTIERWRSPDSSDAGEVKLVRSFDANGMPCRTLDFTIRVEVKRNSPRHFVSTWCKVADVGWKIVELPPR